MIGKCKCGEHDVVVLVLVALFIKARRISDRELHAEQCNLHASCDTSLGNSSCDADELHADCTEHLPLLSS